MCTPPCQHGGLCTGPNVCSCSGNWTGAQCEQRKSTGIYSYSQYDIKSAVISWLSITGVYEWHATTMEFWSPLYSYLQSTLSKWGNMYITRSVSLHCKLEWKSVSARYICKYSPQSHTLNILLLNPHFFHSNMQSGMSKWRALRCPKCLFMSQWLDWKSLWRRYVAKCVYKKIVNNYLFCI